MRISSTRAHGVSSRSAIGTSTSPRMRCTREAGFGEQPRQRLRREAPPIWKREQVVLREHRSSRGAAHAVALRERSMQPRRRTRRSAHAWRGCRRRAGACSPRADAPRGSASWSNVFQIATASNVWSVAKVASSPSWTVNPSDRVNAFTSALTSSPSNLKSFVARRGEERADVAADLEPRAAASECSPELARLRADRGQLRVMQRAQHVRCGRAARIYRRELVRPLDRIAVDQPALVAAHEAKGRRLRERHAIDESIAAASRASVVSRWYAQSASTSARI